MIHSFRRVPRYAPRGVACRLFGRHRSRVDPNEIRIIGLSPHLDPVAYLEVAVMEVEDLGTMAAAHNSGDFAALGPCYDCDHFHSLSVSGTAPG